MFQMLGVFAEFERAMIVQRVRGASVPLYRTLTPCSCPQPGNLAW
jgi:hypothetical protein